MEEGEKERKRKEKGRIRKAYSVAPAAPPFCISIGKMLSSRLPRVVTDMHGSTANITVFTSSSVSITLLFAHTTPWIRKCGI